MRSELPKCKSSTDAVAYWRVKIQRKPGFNSRVESFAALVLDSERRFAGAHVVQSKLSGDAQKFAVKLFQSPWLRGVPEFILVQHRPGVALVASDADKERVRAVILAGRARKTELLDCLIVSKPDDVPFGGGFSFHHLKGFSAANPFAKSSKSAHKSSAKAEASQ